MKKKRQSRNKSLKRSYPPAWIQQLETWLEIIRAKKAKGTVRKREVCVKVFFDFMKVEKIKSFQAVTTEHADKFRIYLSKYDYSDDYSEACMRSSNYFFQYLERGYIIFANPFDGVVIPVAKHKKHLILNQEQMKLLLDVPDISIPLGIRDKAILELMYSTGCRRSSLLSMKWSWVNFKDREVTMWLKRDKEKTYPLGKHAMYYLEKYLKEGYRALLSDNNDNPDMVWLNHLGQPLSGNVAKIIKGHAVSVGLPSGTDCHCIRRSCATHFLQGGASPDMVAELLGHNDTLSLHHYLNISQQAVMDMHGNSKLGE